MEAAVFKGVRLSGALFQIISKSPVLGIREIVAGATGAVRPKVSAANREGSAAVQRLRQAPPV
jgi:hypothetical protein